MLRIEAEKFGAPRNAIINALQAEGIPCSAGYGFSLHRQPMFRKKAFGPYLPNASARVNFDKTNCPNSDQVCEQCIWLEQSIFLGTRADMDDIARACEKIFENGSELNDWWKSNRLRRGSRKK
jgi:dTDP-4-amino-4,6-dideoxygalactose transaminase